MRRTSPLNGIQFSPTQLGDKIVNTSITTFSDIIVSDEMLIRPNLHHGLTFVRCTFKVLTIDTAKLYSLTFYDCDFDQINILDSDLGRIKFVSCTGDMLYCKMQPNTGQLQIENDLDEDLISSIERIEIHCAGSSLEVNHTEFTTLRIQGHTHSVSIGYCGRGAELPIVGNVSLSGKPDRVNIIKSHLYSVSMDRCETVFADLNDSRIERLQVEQSDVKSFDIENCTIYHTTIFKSTLEDMTVQGGEYHEIILQLRKLVSLDLSRSNVTERMVIKNFTLNNITLASNTSIHVKGVNFGQLFLDHINNKGTIEVTDCTIKHLLSLQDADIGHTKFKNVSLEHCRAIKLRNALLTDARFLNVRWPRDYKLYDYRSEISKVKNKFDQINDYYYPLKEAYRQLKMVSSKELNKIDSAFFQQQELRVYSQILKFTRGKRDHLGDYLVLYTNKLFSDFGQSIWRPLGWWLLVHSILMFFLFYCVGIDFGVQLTWPRDWELAATGKGIGIFLNLLSPVHSNTIHGQNIFGVVDFLLRLSSAYFLYYFLIATRKFHFS